MPERPLFLSLQDACEKLEAWRKHYNEERPRSAIGNTPSTTWEREVRASKFKLKHYPQQALFLIAPGVPNLEKFA